MNSTVSFQDIYHLGKEINCNEKYTQNHSATLSEVYDANFISFKMVPSLAEFKELEREYKKFQKNSNQTHLKFIFPENSIINEELNHYLVKSNYAISKLELFMIHSNDFPFKNTNTDISVHFVDSNEKLKDFLYLHDIIDREIGDTFAQMKKQWYEKHYRNEAIDYIVAYERGKPVGYVQLYKSARGIELDSFQVLPKWQKLGIGHQIQQHIMETFPNHTIFLVADSDDTPKEMYKKQGYQFLQYRYEALLMEL
ncbi:putative acetyltransferase [Bacillus sp. TS-2]|nr:putative acetyltransferase [Bacillus sp. TS-2]